MKSFYEYKVKIFDENTTDEVIKHGVTYSKSYGDAAAAIEKSYGDILISMVICKVENFGVEDGTYECALILQLSNLQREGSILPLYHAANSILQLYSCHDCEHH